MSGYPDGLPDLPWSMSVMPADRAPTAEEAAHPWHYGSNARRAQITRVPPQYGTPSRVTTALALWCTRDMAEIVGPCHLLLNAFSVDENGARQRGAYVEIEMKSPGGLVLGTHRLLLDPIHVWLAPGQRSQFIPHATIDPKWAGDPKWSPTFTPRVDISGEVDEWVFHGFPDAPTDPKAPYAWDPTTKSMAIALPCTFKHNIHDLDLNTGQEVFLRSAVNVGTSGSVTIHAA